MSTNMTLITSVTVGSGGAASVTLPATGTIPQTYTDLKVLATARSTRSGSVDDLVIRFNGSSSNYTGKRLYGSGSSATSDTLTDIRGFATGAGTTANTFSNTEFYIPNYTSSTTYKSVSVDAVNENNATESYSGLVAGLWSNNSAITTITLLANNGNLVEGSTFYLYGISNVTSTTKATGGIVSSDGTYNYHMFPYSGTFTPTQNITADYLVIAGGGGGGGASGGGGAGGLRSTVGATGGGGSLESALSLTANTAYTVTVGAGGIGSTSGASPSGGNGSNSVFSTITSTGGGGGGEYDQPGATGGSGGGGGWGDFSEVGGSRTSSPVQGYAGGNNSPGGTTGGAGGGGGAGAAGSNASGTTGGAGGTGVAVSITGSSVTYAGGGGGWGSSTAGSAGSGGGGAGNNGTGSTIGTAGTANTGGGAGSGYGRPAANGGSGLVIIRYAI